MARRPSFNEPRKDHALTSLTLVIPSVARPESLRRALVAAQTHRTDIDEIIVVAREGDSATLEVAHDMGVRVALVRVAGLAQAMRAGAEAARTDVVAFSDDDAAVRDDWGTRLKALYVDSSIGGAGGRDLVDRPDQLAPPRSQSMVGAITPLGKVVGSHHLATGKVRDVEHLKGVNCSFRREAFLRHDFQPQLHGEGAQARNEFVASLSVREAGLRLRFDPDLIVDHYPESRGGADQRGVGTQKMYEAAYNERLGIRFYKPSKSVVNALFLILVGYPHAPGLARLARGAKISEVAAVGRAIVDAQRAVRPEN